MQRKKFTFIFIISDLGTTQLFSEYTNINKRLRLVIRKRLKLSEEFATDLRTKASHLQTIQYFFVYSKMLIGKFSTATPKKKYSELVRQQAPLVAILLKHSRVLVLVFQIRTMKET